MARAWFARFRSGYFNFISLKPYHALVNHFLVKLMKVLRKTEEDWDISSEHIAMQVNMKKKENNFERKEERSFCKHESI